MALFKRKEKKMYLSDKQPLTPIGYVSIGLSYLILAFWSFVILWPLVQIVITTFNGNQIDFIDVGAENFQFSFKHFIYLFEETNYLMWVKNTILISIATAVLTVLMVSFTGYAYSRFRFKGRKPTLIGIMLIQTIPMFAGITAYFTMYSIISEIIPIFSRQMMLVLIYSGGGIATNTFILKGYLDSISTELDDAGKIDGCSHMQIYRLIIMPIAKPMLSIIALWSFIGPFMDFLLPRVMLSDESYTLAAGLWTLINDERNFNQPAFVTGGFLTAIPIVLMFIFLQRYLVSGLTKGSVKG